MKIDKRMISFDEICWNANDNGNDNDDLSKWSLENQLLPKIGKDVISHRTGNIMRKKYCRSCRIYRPYIWDIGEKKDGNK